MTNQALQYLQHLEQVRHNKAQVEETVRSNTAREQETHRTNVRMEGLRAAELSERALNNERTWQESVRSHQEQERITEASNFRNYSENVRHNRATETLNTYQTNLKAVDQSDARVIALNELKKSGKVNTSTGVLATLDKLGQTAQQILTGKSFSTLLGTILK